MKERPILFSGAMVRAILDGRKTQTRRVVKNLDLITDWDPVDPAYGPYFEDQYGDSQWTTSRCPYGQPGDRLWVRETWRPYYDPYLLTSIQYKADMGVLKPTEWETENAQFGMWCEENTGDIPGEGGRFKPSIHMPRCFSRLSLVITDVSVERLQNIDCLDAADEGTPDRRTIENGWDMRDCFRELWNSINGKPRKDGVDISWQANPWVWVVSFQKLEGGAE